MRNQARRAEEKVVGSLPSSTDVDHRKPLIKGGSNRLSNLRPRSASSNRSFKRTKQAKMR